MSGEGEADAETVDELKERRGEVAGTGDVPPGEIAGSGNGPPGDETDEASFYPDTGAYPAGGELPPTGELRDPSPSDALQPEPEGMPEDGEDEPER